MLSMVTEVWTYRKNPLQRQRYTPGPLVISLVVAICGAGDNNLTDGPTHLQSRSAGASKGERDDFAGVGRGVGDEEAPWDTF